MLLHNTIYNKMKCLDNIKSNLVGHAGGVISWPIKTIGVTKAVKPIKIRVYAA